MSTGQLSTCSTGTDDGTLSSDPLSPCQSLCPLYSLPYTKGARLQETYWVTSTTSACPPAGKSERLLYNLQEAQGNS